MKDKIIINTISKIHFILLSAISFIFSILFITFIVLQNGIYIDDISFTNIKAKKLYIKWDEKLSLIVKELDIQNDKSNNDSKINLKDIGNTLKKITLFDGLIKKIYIEKITVDDMSASFKYSDTSIGYLHVESPLLSIYSSLYFEKHLFNINIESFVDKNRGIKIKGNLILNTDESVANTELALALNIKINENTSVDFYGLSTAHKLEYILKSDSKIEDITNIVKMIGDDLPGQFWYTDAIVMSHARLDKAYGYIEYNNLKDAYKNVYVKATVNDLEYTYDKKLDYIDTSHTVIEFKKGLLYIYPKNAYTYGAHLDKSWLNIDFTKKQIPINLYLDFTARLDDKLLSLLYRYNIDLPFKQTKGKLKTKLHLNINITTQDVMATGEFFTKKGQIRYLGMDIDVFNTKVTLNGKQANVKNMLAKYNDKHISAESLVNIDFNAATQKGKLDFKLQKAHLKDIDARLHTKALHVEYIVDPKQDYIIADKSQWNAQKYIISLDKLKMPFSLKTSSLNISNTPFSVNKLADGYISGDIYLKPFKLDLILDLMNISHSDISLNSTKSSLHVKYKNYLNMYSRDTIELNILDKKYRLNDFNLKLKNDTLSLNNIGLDLDKMLDSKLSVNYNLKTNNGYIDLHKIKIENETFGEIYRDNNSSRIQIKNDNNILSMISKKYDFKYTKEDKKWTANFNAISKIAKNSKLLQKYNLIYGQCGISQQNKSNNIEFDIETNYKYKLLINGNKPIKNYEIHGKYNTKNEYSDININDLVYVKIKDDITINTESIGINLEELLSMLSIGNDDSTGMTKNIYFNTQDSYLYLSNNRHVLSESIKVKYINDMLMANLKYKNGEINLKLKDEIIDLYGSDLNDTFMNNLFALSDFKGGNLNFYIHGPLDSYEGILNIDKTTIKDYKILNNILAFVNTIPSLVTFKVPGYSKKGIKIENALLEFEFKNKTYNISNFILKSKEMDIIGEGSASIINNTIDMNLNLKTDLGSSISKIPVVGYILLGKENVSTSLKIAGKLNNPKVKTQVSRDIITAPLNILKRTLLLPLKLLNKKDDNKSE